MLSLRALTFRAAGRALVDAVSLSVAPGEVVAVAGPNGAGKSTLLRLMAGEIEAAQGDIVLNGRPLHRWRAQERARMLAVLPQESRLAFAFTGLEVALFGRYPHRAGVLAREDRQIAMAALALTDAAHLADRDFTTLSGGEKARVQLARVLAQLWTPCEMAGTRLTRLLLLDEPTAALDLKHQHATLAAARRFAQAQGDVGVIAVLHDLNLAAQYADRVLLMRAGAVAAQGTPREVLTRNQVEEIFDIRVRVLRHPLGGTPLIAAATDART
ncbi:MAG: heme ABC transporter ATP-binding protein [Burkholderiales bacterium]|nr:heme ABC transporter ATP-binding protein [Burkholderiales bacterium]